MSSSAADICTLVWPVSYEQENAMAQQQLAKWNNSNSAISRDHVNNNSNNSNNNNNKELAGRWIVGWNPRGLSVIVAWFLNCETYHEAAEQLELVKRILSHHHNSCHRHNKHYYKIRNKKNRSNNKTSPIKHNKSEQQEQENRQKQIGKEEQYKREQQQQYKEEIKQFSPFIASLLNNSHFQREHLYEQNEEELEEEEEEEEEKLLEEEQYHELSSLCFERSEQESEIEENSDEEEYLSVQKIAHRNTPHYSDLQILGYLRNKSVQASTSSRETFPCSSPIIPYSPHRSFLHSPYNNYINSYNNNSNNSNSNNSGYDHTAYSPCSPASPGPMVLRENTVRLMRQQNDIWLELQHGPVLGEVWCCGCRVQPCQLHVIRVDAHHISSSKPHLWSATSLYGSAALVNLLMRGEKPICVRGARSVVEGVLLPKVMIGESSPLANNASSVTTTTITTTTATTTTAIDNTNSNNTNADNSSTHDKSNDITHKQKALENNYISNDKAYQPLKIADQTVTFTNDSTVSLNKSIFGSLVLNEEENSNTNIDTKLSSTSSINNNTNVGNMDIISSNNENGLQRTRKVELHTATHGQNYSSCEVVASTDQQKENTTTNLSEGLHRIYNNSSSSDNNNNDNTITDHSTKCNVHESYDEIDSSFETTIKAHSTLSTSSTQKSETIISNEETSVLIHNTQCQSSISDNIVSNNGNNNNNKGNSVNSHTDSSGYPHKSVDRNNDKSSSHYLLQEPSQATELAAASFSSTQMNGHHANINNNIGSSNNNSKNSNNNNSINNNSNNNNSTSSYNNTKDIDSNIFTEREANSFSSFALPQAILTRVHHQVQSKPENGVAPRLDFPLSIDEAEMSIMIAVSRAGCNVREVIEIVEHIINNDGSVEEENKEKLLYIHNGHNNKTTIDSNIVGTTSSSKEVNNEHVCNCLLEQEKNNKEEELEREEILHESQSQEQWKLLPEAKEEHEEESKNRTKFSLTRETITRVETETTFNEWVLWVVVITISFLTRLVHLLSKLSRYSYTFSIIEIRMRALINFLSLLTHKTHSCGLHPVLPHLLTRHTVKRTRVWCVGNFLTQLVLDCLLGTLLCLLLATGGPPLHGWAVRVSRYFLYETHMSYLDWFDGWPAGLKVNGDLNITLCFFAKLVMNLWDWLMRVSPHHVWQWWTANQHSSHLTEDEFCHRQWPQWQWSYTTYNSLFTNTNMAVYNSSSFNIMNSNNSNHYSNNNNNINFTNTNDTLNNNGMYVDCSNSDVDLYSFHYNYRWIPPCYYSLVLISITGASCAFAFVADLSRFVSLQLQLLYHIMSLLMRLAVSILSNLFRQFRGQRYNPIRERVDAYDFNLDQMLLATFLFTIAVFLFPTLMVYYLYFAFIRVTIWYMQRMLSTIGFIILYIPLFPIIYWYLYKTKWRGGVGLSAPRISRVKGNLLSGSSVRGDGASYTVDVSVHTIPLSFTHAISDFVVVMRLLAKELNFAKMSAILLHAKVPPETNLVNKLVPHLRADSVNPPCTLCS